MANEIVTAISEIATVLRTVTALKNVQQYPPEQMNYDLYAVIYPNSGSVDVAPTGTRETLHNINIDVLRQRTDLARDMTALYPLIDSIPNALMLQVSYDSDGTPGSQFNDSIETFGNLSYSLIQSDYGGTPVIGYRFIMEETKIQVNL